MDEQKPVAREEKLYSLSVRYEAGSAVPDLEVAFRQLEQWAEANGYELFPQSKPSHDPKIRVRLTEEEKAHLEQAIADKSLPGIYSVARVAYVSPDYAGMSR